VDHSQPHCYTLAERFHGKKSVTCSGRPEARRPTSDPTRGSPLSSLLFACACRYSQFGASSAWPALPALVCTQVTILIRVAPIGDARSPASEQQGQHGLWGTKTAKNVVDVEHLWTLVPTPLHAIAGWDWGRPSRESEGNRDDPNMGNHGWGNACGSWSIRPHNPETTGNGSVATRSASLEQVVNTPGHMWMKTRKAANSRGQF